MSTIKLTKQQHKTLRGLLVVKLKEVHAWRVATGRTDRDIEYDAVLSLCRAVRGSLETKE